MWNRGTGGCGCGRSVSVLGIGVVGIALLLATFMEVKGDGPTKDITLVRPKHLKYQSYRSLQQNESLAEEMEKRRHRSRSYELLQSEESRQSPHPNPPSDENNERSPATRKYANGSTEALSSNTQKRSLLPGHGVGAGVFGNHDKSARFGPLGIQKSPPDLQFGLAFTVPFVSLSTDKLINTFSGKSYGNHNDVSNILKLNLGGLLAAVIVGIGAFFLVPGLLHAGKIGGPGGGLGWGSSILDSIFPHGIPGILDHFLGGHGHHHHPDGDGWGHEDHVGHRPFGYQDYYEYNGVHNHNRKDTSAVLREKSTRREGRKGNETLPHAEASELIGNLISSVGKFAKQYVSTAQNCLQLQICRKATTSTKEKKERKEDEDGFDFIGLIESVSDNDLVKDSPMSQEIKKAHEHGQKHGECKKYENPECV